MREASGWSVEEPTPTRNTATRTAGSDEAKAKSTMPSVVLHIPAGRLRTKGRLSNASPTTGWKTDEAIW